MRGLATQSRMTLHPFKIIWGPFLSSCFQRLVPSQAAAASSLFKLV